MKYAEFKTNIEEIYKRYFPESICNVRIVRCLGQMICIDCFLAGSKAEMPYGYTVNDMFSVSFTAFLPDNFNVEDDLPENLTVTSDSHSYKQKSESRYLAYDRAVVPYRKTTMEKFPKAFERFVKRLHDSVAADIEAGKIADGYVEIAERKVK